jgi:hypothetical protein
MKDERNNLLLQYAGLAMQLLVSLLAAVWVGDWVDKKMNTKIPLLLWILPLLVIIGMIIKAIKDTSNK